MRPIDADELITIFSGGEAMKSVAESIHDERFVDALRKAPTVEAIPIAVIKRAIAGLSAADQCDQAGRYERELRDALNTVLKWYGSPGYQEHEKRTAHG